MESGISFEDMVCAAAQGRLQAVGGAAHAAPCAGERPCQNLVHGIEIVTELGPLQILKWSQWSLLMVHGGGDAGEFLQFFCSLFRASSLL